jgi:hypothetical protein
MTQPWLLPPDQVVDEARRLNTHVERGEWADLAVLVGRIRDEELWVDAFKEMETFCLARLELSAREMREYLRLWDLMKAALPKVVYDAWRGLAKARALIVVDAVRLGGDPSTWYWRALDAESAQALQEVLDRMRGRQEEWVNFELLIPASVAEVVEAALIKAVPVVFPEEAELKTARNPVKRAALLEEVCRAYIVG